MTMKAYITNGKNDLDLVEQPEPEPSFGQVMIRVRATSLNYRDLIVQRGEYTGQKSPLIPMSDGAGDIVAIGDGVNRVKVGDRVAATFFQNWISGRIGREVMSSDLGGAIDGMLAEYVVLDQQGVVKLPDRLSYVEGATLPCAGVTAWHALMVKGNLQAGETVLVLGTGGVSVFATQFAKSRGAKVIATSSSDEKLERMRQLGADETINYQTTPDWEKQVYDLTDRVGADCVVEVGGAGTLDKSLQAVRYGGQIHLIGVLSGFTGEINPLPILFKSITVNGIYVGNRDMFEEMNLAIASSQLKPAIDRVFPFVDAAQAYNYLKSGSHLGKVAIEL
ncbi:MAG: NAD(P)-dependent alcohol dehydrogenase [Cyanosarcina radialis HA8281-LM2]|jgi:NADPH:quinone reductase-like Zn-dependent oxidoreductase|nr:NAD(P)-dependent alcohol dehydrogenase [Cyanosarcina radialis HA8281-LM2]